MEKRPVVLMILDGYGLNDNCEANAVCEGKTPIMDQLMSQCPFVKGQASGLAVGLPDGQMGNSEVGHLNMGAGRIVYQELTRITKSIQDGDFFKNEEFLAAVENCKKNNSALHLFGLLSDGGVHSHITHVYGLLELAKRNGLDKVFVHCFLDGRDTPPASGKDFVAALEEKMKELGVGKVASVMGRYYAMDRDKRWDRVQKAYNAIALGEGVKQASSELAIKNSYEEDTTDEFVVPVVVGNYAGMTSNDGAIFFNFRPDRARELTHAFVDTTFDGFVRNEDLKIPFATMTQYEKGMNVEIAYKPEFLTNTLGEYVSKLGYTQLRIAETEKYAHVTFFFNGGIEQPYEGEDRILVPSPKVATYDLQPEMSAIEVTDKVVEAILSKKYDFIILNYANGDMVGHTGVMEAAVKAVETVDTCVGRFVDAIKQVGGTVCITADHGNAEKMLDEETKEAFTAHTTNPVPFIVVSDKVKEVKDGALCDIAPTLLKLAGLEVPAEMTGKALID